MWVIHWGLFLRLPWRTWVCPCEDQVWRWCSCLGLRGSGSTRYSGESAAGAAGNVVLRKGMATSIGQYAPVFLPGERPSLTEKPGRPQSTGLQWVRHCWSDPVSIGERHFFCLGHLCPVGFEREGSAAAWLAEVLAVPRVQGHGLPLLQELRPSQSLLSSFLQLAIRRPLWPVFPHNSTHWST